VSSFRFGLRVRYHECDPQGVVFNANYLTYFDIVITELWRKLGGYSEMVAAGLDLVVAEATVRYRSPLRFDDEFEGRAGITRLGKTSMIVAISLVRGEEVCADGENRYVFIGTESGQKSPIPERLRAAMGSYLAGDTRD
jgi:acyl-CoA thioester hydrolase